MEKQNTKVKEKMPFQLKRKQQRLIFYVSITCLPIVQFCIFYIGVNVNSFLLAFRQYEIETATYSWVGIQNFSAVLKDIFSPGYLKSAFVNSFILYGVNIFIGIVFALVFSYYIAKNMRMSGVFKIMLFLPQIISAIVIVLMFKYFTDRAVPTILEELLGIQIPGLVSDTSTAFGTILFYTVWAGFGTQVLLYTGAMSGISESVIEAGKLDGTTAYKEFIYITLPSIYPTIVTFVVLNTANLFLNQMNLFSFYGNSAEYSLYNVGYFLYKSIQTAQTFAIYPYLSAFGLLLTFIAIPLTLGIKYFLEKFGPTTD